jgi:hypothetical protein
MSTLIKELKVEISRLARKEIHKELTPVRRIGAAHRGRIAELVRLVAALQKELGVLQKAVPAAKAVVPAAGAEAGGRFWITGKGVRSLRKRLGLTQAGLGKLAGVSTQTVVNWEGTKGKIEIRRKDTVGRLQAIRGMNKRAVKAVLGEGAKAKAKAVLGEGAKAKAKAKAQGKAKVPAKA